MSPLARPFLCLLLALAACAHPTAPPARHAVASAADISPIAPGVWLHRTYARGMEANGLVVETTHGAILIDTGWSDADATALFEWGRAHGHPITDVVVTHAHDDRAGGLAEARRRGARIHAGAATAGLLGATGGAIDALVSPAALDLDGTRLEVFFPGAGHSRDNVVVWVPRARVLFGGCFLKSPDAADLGNVADADLAAWPASLDTVAARYPEAVVAIPGHGPFRGTAAIGRTRELLAAAP